MQRKTSREVIKLGREDAQLNDVRDLGECARLRTCRLGIGGTPKLLPVSKHQSNELVTRACVYIGTSLKLSSTSQSVSDQVFFLAPFASDSFYLSSHSEQSQRLNISDYQLASMF